MTITVQDAFTHYSAAKALLARAQSEPTEEAAVTAALAQAHATLAHAAATWIKTGN